MKKRTLLLGIICLFMQMAFAEDGSRLWLPKQNGGNASITTSIHTPTTDIAVKELQQNWDGPAVHLQKKKDKQLSEEGYRINHTGNQVTITSPTDQGLLYAAYHLIRLQQTQEWDKTTLPIVENPVFPIRILNHWDNLDGTIERGYAGKSLWNWEELPAILSPRYETYARANASIGINGTVLNNVNASPQILSAPYLQKVKSLADAFRPYGIKVYLSVNFASPMVLDSLETADPLNKEVIRWWKNKVKEIYQLIPDFGGFLVKANSEGQPGPCDFGRTHAEGANMLADALKPFKGIVMWRAFVYNANDADRAKQAYQEFKPLDGQFRENVIIQTKNGPVDFQPREPYSPLFTAIEHTDQMVEFQVTQEYLGHSNHIAYLAPMWKEFFNFVPAQTLKAVAGVSNIGMDVNWCGHPFAQSNWYAFGRLAWNPSLTSEEIAEEWMKQTFCSEKGFIEPVKQLMLESHEAVVDYMMPMGLHHLFAWGHHYGPEPWCDIAGARADWMPSYYHKADKKGLGFNRSSTGSNATAQYPAPLADLYNDMKTCPEEYILWFHHVPWDYVLSNGRTLWESLCFHYDRGVQQVRKFQKLWDQTESYVDEERFKEIQTSLKTQVRDAIWWKDACLLYFQEFSQMPFPNDYERPIHTLEDLKKVNLGITNYECPTEELLNRNR